MGCVGSAPSVDNRAVFKILIEKIDKLANKVDKLETVPEDTTTIKGQLLLLESKIEDIEPRVDNLESQLAVVEKDCATKADTQTSVQKQYFEYVIGEMNDHARRMKDLMIFDAPEFSRSGNKDVRKAYDLKNVSAVVASPTDVVDATKIEFLARVGQVMIKRDRVNLYYPLFKKCFPSSQKSCSSRALC